MICFVREEIGRSSKSLEKDMKKTTVEILFVSVASLFCFALMTEKAIADRVILINGDSITGAVVRADKSKLVLKTGYAGDIEIQIDQIKSIATDNPVEVHLAGGEVLKGRLGTAEAGKLAVEKSLERTAATVEISRVIAINPPPEPPAGLKGDIALSGAYQSGNTKRRSFNAEADVAIEGRPDRFEFRLLLNDAEEQEEVTARSIYGALKYDHFFKKQVYGFVGLEMLKDRFKDLNLQTAVGPGVGYQFWDDADKSLLLEAGLTYYVEDRCEAEDDDWLAARFAAALRYALSKFLTVSDRLEIYPNLSDADDFSLRNEAAVVSPIGGGWSLKLENILEHKNNPPLNVSKTDVTWLLGMQYAF
jgi:putative salt-induced outer membrane protein YdiY